MSKRILIIEDNADLTHLLAVHLRDLSYEVDIAEDGASGLAKAQRTAYDLVLLDLMLPGAVDGLEVCRRIRERSSHSTRSWPSCCWDFSRSSVPCSW